MKKFLLRNKNRIFSLMLVVLVASSSVMVFSLDVSASYTEAAWALDENGDGEITMNEVNPVEAFMFLSTISGYFYDDTIKPFLDTYGGFRDWWGLGVDLVFGFLDETGIFTINDDAWYIVHEVANAIRGNDGYTAYPAMPADRLYYYNLQGCNYEGTELGDVMSSEYDSYFQTGVAVAYTSNYYKFLNPTYFNSSNGNLNQNYFSEFGSYVFVKEGSFIYPYKMSLEDFSMTKVIQGWYHPYRYFGSSKFTSGNDKYRDSNTGGRTCIAVASQFKGLINANCIVFDNATTALSYFMYERTIFDGSEYGINPKIALPDLNKKDWSKINLDAHNSIGDSLLELGTVDINQSQQVINDYTQEILSSLDRIEDSEVEQVGFLQKIYELLKKYLPKIGSSGGDTNINVDLDGETEQPSVDKFGSDSSDQSSNLSDLNEQTQVDKPNVDDMSSQIDENLDIEIDSNYGSVLASLTSNSNILTMLIVSVSVALISYILFGKK